MKTLNDHLLLYDKDCPLCCWYSNIFVQRHWLDEKGRVAYQDIRQQEFPEIDFEIAKNKIALLNTQHHSVSYGLDALRTMLSIPFPFVDVFLKFKPFYRFMSQVYLFISMNRKVIIPVSCNRLGSCNPSRDWFCRIIFILFGAGLFCLGLFTLPFNLPLIISGPFLLGQFGFQYWACQRLKENNSYDYVGHLGMVNALFGFFLLVCNGLFNIVQRCLPFDIRLAQTILLILLTALAVFEHHRRLRITEMKLGLTLTLLFYILLFILFKHSPWTK